MCLVNVRETELLFVIIYCDNLYLTTNISSVQNVQIFGCGSICGDSCISISPAALVTHLNVITVLELKSPCCMKPYA